MEIPKQEVIIEAIRVLRHGGIVIFPTDTAFGIGCRMDDKNAVNRLFAIRKRPLTQATPVLVASEAMALAYYINPSEVVRRLMKVHWPGALTIISHCRTSLVYSPIRGGGKTIGLRMPDHEAALALIRGVGVPILGPSANFHSYPTPYRFEDLDPDLINFVDLVVPGKCKTGNASTVVDCSVTPYRIIRQGVITLQPPSITIDSSGSEAICVVLQTPDGSRYDLKKSVSQAKAQEILPMIEELLSAHNMTPADLSEIRVNTGPGSYTGLRVGVAVASMLVALLGVPVNGLPVGQTVAPIYQSDRW